MMFIMLDRAKPPTPVQLANARKRRPCPGSRGHWPKSSQRARSWVTSTTSSGRLRSQASSQSMISSVRSPGDS